MLVRLCHLFSWYNLRTLTPVSNMYGLDRGESGDRFYMEKFLSLHGFLGRDFPDRIIHSRVGI